MPEKSLTAAGILAIYKEYRVPYRVIKHMIKVAEFALKLCDKLEKKSYKIDKDTIIKACLLHDIVRIADFRGLNIKKLDQIISLKVLNTWEKLIRKYKGKSHEEAAKEILNKKGYKKIANIVGNHGFFSIDKLKTLEEKILYYSDKRVEGCKVVRLKTRFKKGSKRNFSPGNNPEISMEKVKKTEKKVFELEREIKILLRTVAH